MIFELIQSQNTIIQLDLGYFVWFVDGARKDAADCGEE